MIITIKRSDIIFGADHVIAMNGHDIFKTTRTLSSMLQETSIFDCNSNELILSATKRFTLFSTCFDLHFSEGSTASFDLKSFWKEQYQCITTFGQFDIYVNDGRRSSIFRNNVQVAYWEAPVFESGHDEKYKIVANDEENIALLVLFCLLLDNEKGGTSININFGFKFPGSKPFDKDWQPNTDSNATS
jgi:hypothetical protein